MSELSQLSPQPLWDIFAKICSIPHPSYHEEQLAEYIVGWAKEKGFHVERDQVGNILIRKPATAGMENRKPVVLQAHLDMVPQKNNDTVHDFTKDPIQPYIDGEWVKARGTTLGADNGIGMASALAVLADENVVHGPLEVLLTMTEEAGMDGAFGLQSNWLQADILINTDSEEEGEIYMGCAGGIDFTSNLHLDREAVPAGFETFKLTLKGLKGGHSGGEQPDPGHLREHSDVCGERDGGSELRQHDAHGEQRGGGERGEPASGAEGRLPVDDQRNQRRGGRGDDSCSVRRRRGHLRRTLQLEDGELPQLPEQARGESGDAASAESVGDERGDGLLRLGGDSRRGPHLSLIHI